MVSSISPVVFFLALTWLPLALSNVAKTRHLLPHPPTNMHGDSNKHKYEGCLGLSDEERAKAWHFDGDAPPCTIEVNSITVAGVDNTYSSTSSSGSGSDSSSQYSQANGGSSLGGSGNSSSGSGSGGAGDSNISTGGDESISGSDEDKSTTSNGSGYEYDSANDSGETSGNFSGSDNGSSSNGGSEESDISSSNNGGNEATSSGNDDSSSSSNAEDEDGSSASPLRYFNISDCGSYSNMWVWDLAISCEDDTISPDSETCSCTQAEILFQYGTLECPGTTGGSQACPLDCPVCNTCLLLLGCLNDTPGSNQLTQLNQEESSEALPIAVGVSAMVATVLIGYYYHQYKKSTDLASGELGADFIAEEPPVNSML